MNVGQHLDYDALNALREVMEDNFELLIDTFIQDSTTRLSTLQEMAAGTARDADAIRRAAHSFKGSCGNMGAPRLTYLCTNVELKAVAADFDNLVADVQAVEDEFLVVKQLLRTYLG
jgi:HPt (histidine-containing phosphotransfer) domain-containing protein